MMKKENEIALLVAYYLSRFDTKAYKNLAFGSITQTHKQIGKILGVKPSTLKNMRDEFDPYHPNQRAGWHQRKMLPTRKKVLERYSSKNEEQIRELVEKLIRAKLPKRILFTPRELGEITTDDRQAIEGELIEKKVMLYKRNSKNTKACKERDNHTCQACGFWHENRIVECHHLNPLSMAKERIVKIGDLLTLCPTCHRLSHNLLGFDEKKYTNKKVLIASLKGIIGKRAPTKIS